MPAKKKYFSEEERKAAQRESYKRYNSSIVQISLKMMAL